MGNNNMLEKFLPELIKTAINEYIEEVEVTSLNESDRITILSEYTKKGNYLRFKYILLQPSIYTESNVETIWFVFWYKK